MSLRAPLWKRILGWTLFFALVLVVIYLRYHWFRELQQGWFEQVE